MKIKSYHITNLGSFAPSRATQDSQGFVAYHCSERYATATESQLDGWADSRVAAVRNAALTEAAGRALAAWQKEN